MLQIILLLAGIGWLCWKLQPPRRSKGQRAVEDWLWSQGYFYTREYTVTIANRRLRYDLRVLWPPTLIEFDGRQHFEYTPRFHKNPKGFRDSQHRDRLKTQWAKRNGWVLIRIATGDNPGQHLARAFAERPWLYLSNFRKYRYLSDA